MTHIIGLAGLLLTAAAQAPAALQPPDATAVAAACGGERPMAEVAALPAAERRALLTCFTRESAVRFDAQLPQRIDDVTVLDRVRAEGTELIYHYSTSLVRANVPASAIESMRTGLQTRVCGAENMRSVIQIGGSYRYLYRDANGEPLAEMRVASC